MRVPDIVMLGLEAEEEAKVELEELEHWVGEVLLPLWRPLACPP